MRPHWREIGLVLHPHRFDAHGAAAHGTRPGRNASTPASTCSGTARPAWVRRRGPVCGPGAAVSASGALRERRRLPLGRAARRLQLLLELAALAFLALPLVLEPLNLALELLALAP